MTYPFDFVQARRQLELLGERIQSGRSAVSRSAAILADEIERDWQDVARRHQELSEKLRKGAVAGSQAAETLRHDIDELRHGFSRWAARVERSFNNGSGKS